MSGQEAPDVGRLRRLLGGEHTAWLLDRVRRRMELGKPLTGTVTLSHASQEQRRAAERLLGRRAGTGTSLTVSLDEIDAVLRSSGAVPDGLAAAVRILVGDVGDRVAQAAAEAAAWSAAHAPLDEVVARRPELAVWRSWLDATGMLRRLAPNPDAAGVLAAEVVRVLDALPSPAGVALGRLAAASTGDAHALDDGRPLATLALAAARVLCGAPPVGDGSAAERRAAWAAVGVHRDELSSSVLCLGLPGGGGSVAGRILAVAREAGEPCVLTLRQLGRDGVDLGVGGGLVWVCENPIVVASAADELAGRCPPLVCVNGQPSAAVTRLLDLLAADGAHFAYHGDFDWGGIRIGNGLRDRIPWQPWRFDTAAYRAALAGIAGVADIAGVTTAGEIGSVTDIPAIGGSFSGRAGGAGGIGGPGGVSEKGGLAGGRRVTGGDSVPGGRVPGIPPVADTGGAGVVAGAGEVAGVAGVAGEGGVFDGGGFVSGSRVTGRDGVPGDRISGGGAGSGGGVVIGGGLTGRPVGASWDADLRPAMERHAVRVDEELVLPALIADLAAASATVDPTAHPPTSSPPYRA